jgi:hypothetical protein
MRHDQSISRRMIQDPRHQPPRDQLRPTPPRRNRWDLTAQICMNLLRARMTPAHRLRPADGGGGGGGVDPHPRELLGKYHQNMKIRRTSLHLIRV